MNTSYKNGAKRYFTYIRVSTIKQGEHGVSLQEQIDSIKRYASRNGLEIVAEFEEQETAAKSGRPIFSHVLKLLRGGKAEGLIIHKIDRSARNLKDWADLGQLIDQGIEVHFCHESLDLHSRSGRLSADIQAVIAADFIRNLREETRKGFYGRLKQGLYPLRAPLGYLDMGGGNPKEPDPATAPLVKRAFERYATGTVGLIALREELEKLGLRNRNGGPFSLNGLSVVLNNPFYTGMIRIKRTREMYPGKHKPLISIALFEGVQNILRGKRQRRGFKHDFMFRRLFKCKHCNTTLIGERQKGHVYYRCHTTGCPTTCVREEAIEAAIRETLSRIEISPDEAVELETLISKLRDNWEDEQRKFSAALNIKKGQIQSRLDRLTDAFVDGAIDKETFIDRKGRLVRDQRVLEEKSAKGVNTSQSVVDRVSKFLELAKTAYSSYIRAIPLEKRELLESVTSNRWVERKNVELELPFALEALANWRSFTCGDPKRGTPRTFDAQRIFQQLIDYFSAQ